MSVALSAEARGLLAGERGPAMQLAMRLVVKAAEIMSAERLIPISFAHLDACFYTGRAHVDFVRYLLDNGAALAVERDLAEIEQDFSQSRIPEDPTYVSHYTEFLKEKVVSQSVHTASPGFIGSGAGVLSITSSVVSVVSTVSWSVAFELKSGMILLNCNSGEVAFSGRISGELFFGCFGVTFEDPEF